jgi:hypothetical protein
VFVGRSCTVSTRPSRGFFFPTEFTLEGAIGSHACPLQASRRATNGSPLGCSLLLPVHTVNCVKTLKDSSLTTTLPSPRLFPSPRAGTRSGCSVETAESMVRRRAPCQRLLKHGQRPLIVTKFVQDGPHPVVRCTHLRAVRPECDHLNPQHLFVQILG